MNTARRQFFQRSLALAGALVVAPALLSTLKAQAEEGRRSSGAGAATPTLVDPNDPMAKSLGFVLDSTKSPESKGNKCATCSLYSPGAKKDGKDAGACQLFKDKVVYANSFCKSWSKKA